MNQVMNSILSRRSIRKYQEKQLEKEHLETILQAGIYAPNAGGRQSAIFVVCQDRKLNEELGALNIQKLKEILNNRPVEKRLPLPGAEDGIQPKSAFRGAPTVVTLFAPKGWYNFTLDCAVAAENMMLAAQSLGVGSCMIARAAETFDTPRGKEIQRKWEISEEYEAKLYVLLGYPEGDVSPAKPRRDGRILFVSGE